MVFLDASALLAHLRDEPAGPEVERLIRGGGATIPAANLAEVIGRVLRRSSISPEGLHTVLAPLLDDLVAVSVIDRRIAWRAGQLRATHYDRNAGPLSLADSLLLASAGDGDSIASSDGPLLRAAEAEGITTIVLPDSRGNRQA